MERSEPVSRPDLRTTWFPVESARDVDKALQAMRAHLGMDVAFVSEFVGDTRVIRHVDVKSGSGRSGPLAAGDANPIDSGYCKKVVDGQLSRLIPDTGLLPELRAIPETHLMPIGAHLSVPLHRSDGAVFGTFCCFSFEPDPTLNQRDLETMTAFAASLAVQLDSSLSANRERAEAKLRIGAVLASGEPSIMFQPVMKLADMRLSGAEALARFSLQPVRPPDTWFAEAAHVGAGIALELKAMGNALAAFAPAWARGPLDLALNSSPATILDGGIVSLLAGMRLDRIVIEITEHDQIDDYGAFNRALRPLRQGGVRIAIDDAGSGHSSMRHILDIEPDFIKLDISLTREINLDRKRKAMAAALIAFGRQTNCLIVAEGVETAAALATLRELHVDAAQGYHLGRPMPIADFLALPVAGG